MPRSQGQGANQKRVLDRLGIVESRYGEWNGQSVRFLDEIELLEIRVVWKGAAIGTRTVEVRSAPATAAPPESELDAINARLDQLASNERPRDPDAASAVDDLILDVREELVREALDRAEAAAWEGRMGVKHGPRSRARSGRREDAAGDRLNTRDREGRFRYKATPYDPSDQPPIWRARSSPGTGDYAERCQPISAVLRSLISSANTSASSRDKPTH